MANDNSYPMREGVILHRWPDGTVLVHETDIKVGALVTGYLYTDSGYGPSDYESYLGPGSGYGEYDSKHEKRWYVFAPMTPTPEHIRRCAAFDVIRYQEKALASAWPHKCDRCGAPALHMSSIIDCSKRCCKERTY